MSVSPDMELSLHHPLNTQAHTGHLPVMRLSWTHRWQPGHAAAPARAVPFAAHEVRAELDAIAAVIRAGAIEAGVGRLRTFLHDFSRRVWPSGWQVLARTVVREHPLIDVIHESPFARAAFQRGGDVGTLDFLHDTATPPSGTTERGRRIAACELDGDTPRGLRAARDLIARAIDDLVFERPDARIRSVGCDALRERQVSNRRSSLDLIASAGLYEHLSDTLAAKWTARLFAMLAPRGRLLIANLTPQGSDHGYLEACMDWWMTYRDERAIGRLMAAVPRDDVASVRTFRDATGLIGFFEMVRG